MFGKVMDVLFGCRHSHYSFPLTIRPGSRRTASSARIGTYVVCLDCGREFSYDWQHMRLAAAEPAKAARALVTKEAA
jgi:hypothetical protein